MAKTNISDKIFAFVPITTQTILGSNVHGKANFMALGWLTRCNYKPPMIAVAVNKSNQSCHGILDNGEFSVNVPSTDMVAITDYTGLVSAKKTDKSEFHRFERSSFFRFPDIRSELLRYPSRVHIATCLIGCFQTATIKALTCFCIFGRWPKIQVIR